MSTTALITAVVSLVTALGIAVPAIIVAIRGNKTAKKAVAMVIDHKNGDPHP